MISLKDFRNIFRNIAFRGHLILCIYQHCKSEAGSSLHLHHSKVRLKGLNLDLLKITNVKKYSDFYENRNKVRNKLKGG